MRTGMLSRQHGPTVHIPNPTAGDTGARTPHGRTRHRACVFTCVSMPALRLSGRRVVCVALFVAIASLCATRLGAQGLGSEKHDIATFTGDIWSVWTSP